mgnify:FL=1
MATRTKTHIAYGSQNSGFDVEVISASTTLSQNDSGKLFMLNGDVGATITMPSPQSGARFKFVLNENTPNTAFTIDCGAGLLEGNLQNASAHARANGDQSCVFGTTAVKGDFADFESDGTSWYVAATTVVSGAITFTQ